VEPPDLEKYKKFKLPVLRENNIFCCDFFDPHLPLEPKNSFDWIVGNPPWKKARSNNTEDRFGLDWIEKNKNIQPAVDNEFAEAFAWRVLEFISDNGVIGLLMPAMTLVKKSKTFREKFFDCINAWYIFNFANLRRRLFPGSISPPAALFYSPKGRMQKGNRHSIIVYSPLVANQLLQRPQAMKDGSAWSITIDASMIREISELQAQDGNNAQWKISMWGSNRDKRLISKFHIRFDSFKTFAEEHLLKVNQGIELRDKQSKEPLEPVPEIINKDLLLMKELEGLRRFLCFPENAIGKVKRDEAFVRKGRKEKPLRICRPPHIIVDECRKFSVFSNEFLVVPHPQIGIAGESHQADLLKAISLYLMSDFVLYHQFLISSAWGVERDRATRADLMEMPIPFADSTDRELKPWVELYEELSKSASQTNGQDWPPTTNDSPLERDPSNGEIDRLTNRLLGLTESETWLIQDLLNVKLKLIEGRVADEAIRPATTKEMSAYAKILVSEIDTFLEVEPRPLHQVTVFYSDELSILKLQPVKRPPADGPRIEKVDKDAGGEFAKLKEKLRERWSQWLYFNRGLRIFEGDITYLVKPLDRLHWLRSQALVDADEIIADKITATGE
jgi:hypothetical protein